MKNKTILLIFFMSVMLFSQTFKEDKIDELLKDYKGENIPGASLLIIQKGNILLEKNYGYANLEEKIPVTSETNFRLASVSKQFTATAVLQLINKGEFSLNSTLTDLFEDFPSYGSKITVHQLLNHTSGLLDYENLLDTTDERQVYDSDVLEVMKKQNKTYFEPGSKYQYSNSAYALLALLVEQYSGLSFNNYLIDNIFKPLEMNNSLAHKEGETIIHNRAYGYSRNNDGFKRDDQSKTSAVLGDGGIYSSVSDLAKWDAALYTNKILPEELFIKSISYNYTSNSDTVNYGYGWHLRKFNNWFVPHHTGSTRGFRTLIYRIPELYFTIILLTNRNEGAMIEIGEKIAEIYLIE